MIARKPMTPKEKGISKYGDVKFALPGEGKFPIDTPAHVRNAEARLHQPQVQKNLTEGQIVTAERTIRKTAKSKGVTIGAKPAK